MKKTKPDLGESGPVNEEELRHNERQYRQRSEAIRKQEEHDLKKYLFELRGAKSPIGVHEYLLHEQAAQGLPFSDTALVVARDNDKAAMPNRLVREVADEF